MAIRANKCQIFYFCLLGSAELRDWRFVMRFNESVTNFPVTNTEIELTNLAFKLSRRGKSLCFCSSSNLAVTLKIPMLFVFFFPFRKCGLVVLNYDFILGQSIYRIGLRFDLIWVRCACAIEVMAD